MFNISEIVNKLNDLIKPVRDWIFAHHNDPIFWIILCVAIFTLFIIGYSALHKEK